MRKELKSIKIITVFTFIVYVLISYLTFNYQSMIAKADSSLEVIIEHERDDKILKYFREPTIDENFEDNKVNVILKYGYSGDIGFDNFNSVDALTNISSITYKLKTINKGSKEKFIIDKNENAILTLGLSTNDKAIVMEVVNSLQKLDVVLVAEPSYIYDTAFNWTSNDAYYSEQWALNGNYGINAESAWDITTGSSTVKVGLFEGGADLNHDDLKGNIFNGNFIGESTSGHGTHVAGIIGAIHNSYGIAGVSGSTMYVLNRSSLLIR